MVSFRGQKKAWATPRWVSFRGLIQNFRRASPPLSYAEFPPPPSRARYNEPRCNELLSITDGCSYPSNSKIYELKEPRYNETSSKGTYFAYPLALRYIEVLLCNNTVNNNIPARSLPLIFPLFSLF